jgi:site-specific DNA-cytosine methylase
LYFPLLKVTNVNGKQGVLEWFDQFGVRENELVILDESPPCETFSKATGKRVDEKTKHEAKNKQYSEVTQDRVGMLIHDYVYLANYIHPKICIIENVPAVRRHINWNTQGPYLKEDLAHLVQDIKRRICGIASAGSPSF